MPTNRAHTLQSCGKRLHDPLYQLHEHRPSNPWWWLKLLSITARMPRSIRKNHFVYALEMVPGSLFHHTWANLLRIRVLATTQWFDQKREYLTVHGAKKPSKAQTASPAAEIDKQLEVDYSAGKIEKVCQDINEDPELRSPLQRLALVFASWYSDNLELAYEQEAEEAKDVKTKKTKARKKVDATKKEEIACEVIHWSILLSFRRTSQRWVCIESSMTRTLGWDGMRLCR